MIQLAPKRHCKCVLPQHICSVYGHLAHNSVPLHEASRFSMVLPPSQHVESYRFLLPVLLEMLEPGVQSPDVRARCFRLLVMIDTRVQALQHNNRKLVFALPSHDHVVAH